MKQGIQTLMQEAGEAACYALDIIELSERATGNKQDPIGALQKGIDRGFIRYNEKNADDSDNFFVDDPAGFLAMLTGVPWNVEKAPADYYAKPGEYVVDRWERTKTGQVIAHFRLPDWDSLADSATVRFGKIVSRRVFRRI